jgi:hypothetical protein
MKYVKKRLFASWLHHSSIAPTIPNVINKLHLLAKIDGNRPILSEVWPDKV